MIFSIKEVLDYCHVAMCISLTCATNGTNLITTVTQENRIIALKIEIKVVSGV